MPDPRNPNNLNPNGDPDDYTHGLSQATQDYIREAEAGVRIAAVVTLVLFSLCAILGIWLVGKAAAVVLDIVLPRVIY